MALHLPEIDLKGISTVHGNASLQNTTCELAFRASDSHVLKHIPSKTTLLGVCSLSDRKSKCMKFPLLLALTSR